MRRSVLTRAATGALAVLAAVAAPALAARLLQPPPHTCGSAGPCLSAANTFIRADVAPFGTWTLGTTGGDPDTPFDDDQQLLYGFRPAGESDTGSSYTTIRVVNSDGPTDYMPSSAARQRAQNERVETTWQVGEARSVVVTQTVRMADNRFSGRRDVVDLSYDLHNASDAALEVGVRALLDVKLGENDGAPYFIPGVGTVAQESEFVGDAVPAFWQAFESDTYDPSQLRSMGLLRGPDLTTPDRFLLANWRQIQNKPWDFPITPTVDPTKALTVDSAVALFWGPAPLAAGETRTVNTRYGLAGDRGGAAFLSAPVEADCDTTFTAAFFVTNFETVTLTNGSAVLSLPPGVTTAPGTPATQPLADLAPGETGSVVWDVQLGPQVAGLQTLEATATFDGGRQLEAAADVAVACALPTPPTATPTARPSATPTATSAPPTATNLPTPTGDTEACPFVEGRVPPAAIQYALANPSEISGWMQPRNPALPPGPGNPLRTRLSLHNIATPWHPLFNPLVYKVGCP